MDKVALFDPKNVITAPAATLTKYYWIVLVRLAMLRVENS